MNAQAARAKHIAEHGCNVPGNSKPGKLKKTFKAEQGLAIQPFIFAVKACLPDMRDQIAHDDTLPEHKVPADRARIAAARLEYSLDRWRDHKDLATVGMITEAAQKCVPTLNARYLALAGQDPTATKQLAIRVQDFGEALDYFGALTSDTDVRRPRELYRPGLPVVGSKDHMCALA